MAYTLLYTGGQPFTPSTLLDTEGIISVVGTYGYVAALLEDGTVIVSDVARHSNLGQADAEAWTDIKAIAGRRYEIVGLKSDGTCLSTLSTRDLSAWSDIVAISVGEDHVVGRKSDGTIVATGGNGYGQCDLSAWSNIIDIAAGEYYTIGLQSDGTCVAAGFNNYGQTNVGAWTDIEGISACWYSTVGYKSDGTAIGTGDNSEGQLDLSTWTGIVGISTSGWHTVGLKSDGTAVAVGYGASGETDVDEWADLSCVQANYWGTAGFVLEATPHEYEGGCLIPFSGSGVLSKRIITPRSVTGRLRLWSPDRLTLFMETTAFNSLQITRRFVGNCLLEAYFPAYSEEAYYIIEGGWVEDDEGEWYRIHYRRATKDNVQLIAYSPHKVLGQRITVPASGQYGITVTGSADAVIKGLVSQTIANTGRDLPILVAAVRSGGTSISEISRYKNLAEEVERICYANDLGESFTFSATDFIFDTYAGTDRTRGNTAGNAPAIFSVRYDNLEDWSHAIASTDEITTVYVAGQGTGTTRTMVIVGATTTGEDRFEQFRDARDTNSAAILASRGAESVFPPAESFSAKANTSSNLTYNTDYALGDLVTIEIPERTATYDSASGLWNKVERYRSEDKRITEIVRTYEGGAMDIDLVFGEAPKTRGDKQIEVQTNLSRLEAI